MGARFGAIDCVYMTRASLTWICVYTSMAAATAAAQIAPPQVPGNLKVPDTEVVLLKALGKGKQIYVCSAKPGDDSQFVWVLDRPQTDLFDEKGVAIGKHYKGPVWEAADGSKVGGQVQQRANAPNGNAVPWLLLKAASNQGTGTFARVTYVQRVDTEGGWRPPRAATDLMRAPKRWPTTKPLTFSTSQDPMRPRQPPRRLPRRRSNRSLIARAST